MDRQAIKDLWTLLVHAGIVTNQNLPLCTRCQRPATAVVFYHGDPSVNRCDEHIPQDGYAEAMPLNHATDVEVARRFGKFLSDTNGPSRLVRRT
jgi:recombinational DNA repair protein (RecF pathway)